MDTVKLEFNNEFFENKMIQLIKDAESKNKPQFAIKVNRKSWDIKNKHIKGKSYANDVYSINFVVCNAFIKSDLKIDIPENLFTHSKSVDTLIICDNKIEFSVCLRDDGSNKNTFYEVLASCENILKEIEQILGKLSKT